MFKITALAYAVSLVAIQAYPVSDFGAIANGAGLTKRDGCGGVGCGGSGIQFTASNLSPDLTFSTGGRFNLPGMQPCSAVAGQPCATAAPPQQSPPQEMPPQQAPPASGATTCDQAQDQTCPGSTQQTPPQEMPPQQAPPTTPQGCDQAQGQACPDLAQQNPPQQAPSAPGVTPCDQAQGQECGINGPTSLSFNND
ncbi:hypothetical protein GGI01_003319 [Coemansia sp. RSA 376]|nr:hypothetical protein IW146_009329 [Coemansia sp. RSA 922]KAJ2259942.1 hypothetical protein GGI01_003319 [Coemansia sp. RSA 376]KAJ2351085.1 hypothetical protein GGH92_002021 [Coemansia sp. RSA 2673]KAJ2467843.1 hypothetical protein GGI03_001343 [Coemansia sp. RSA 2337]